MHAIYQVSLFEITFVYVTTRSALLMMQMTGTALLLHSAGCFTW